MILQENGKWITENGTEVKVNHFNAKYLGDDEFSIQTYYKKKFVVGDGEPNETKQAKTPFEVNCKGSIERGAVTQEEVENAFAVLKKMLFDTVSEDMFPAPVEPVEETV